MRLHRTYAQAAVAAAMAKGRPVPRGRVPQPVARRADSVAHQHCPRARVWYHLPDRGLQPPASASAVMAAACHPAGVDLPGHRGSSRSERPGRRPTARRKAVDRLSAAIFLAAAAVDCPWPGTRVDRRAGRRECIRTGDRSIEHHSVVCVALFVRHGPLLGCMDHDRGARDSPGGEGAGYRTRPAPVGLSTGRRPRPACARQPTTPRGG